MLKSDRSVILALESCHFPIGILGQVWCLIVSIPDHCSLSYLNVFTIHAQVYVWPRDGNINGHKTIIWKDWIHIWIKVEVGAPLNRFKPSSKIFYWLFQEGNSFVDLLCFSVWRLLCLCVRLFICVLWSPAGKGLTSWLSCVMSNCEFVTFPLVSWVRFGTWLYRFLIFAPLLNLVKFHYWSIALQMEHCYTEYWILAGISIDQRQITYPSWPWRPEGQSSKAQLQQIS